MYKKDSSELLPTEYPLSTALKIYAKRALAVLLAALASLLILLIYFAFKEYFSLLLRVLVITLGLLVLLFALFRLSGASLNFAETVNSKKIHAVWWSILVVGMIIGGVLINLPDIRSSLPTEMISEGPLVTEAAPEPTFTSVPDQQGVPIGVLKTAIPAPTVTPAPTMTPFPSRPAITSPNPTSTSFPGSQVLGSTSRNVNLRHGPGTQYVIIKVIPFGEIVTIIARNAEGTWFVIELQDQSKGWVSADLIDTLVDDSARIAALPVASATELIDPIQPTPTLTSPEP